MSYKIEYNPDKNNIYPLCKKKTVMPMVATLITCCILAFIVFTVDLSAYTRTWFAALDSLALQIKNGTRVGQAVSAYCKEIVSNASVW